MIDVPSGEVTRLLSAWQTGDPVAGERLLALVYDELHQMARRYMGRQKPGQTVQTTALIHDVYVRLVGQPGKPWQGRSHFFAVSSQAMRQILVDYARARRAAKRGGGAQAVPLDAVELATEDRAAEILALDRALSELKLLHPRQARVVECRYFGGMTVPETAEALEVSAETIQRDWKMAKAWLHRALSDGRAA